MNIKVISDTHGFLPDVGNVDLLLIAGDVCPARNHTYMFQEEWLYNDFVNWINKIKFNNPYSMVIMTPGNHDFYFDIALPEKIRKIEKLCNKKLKILINEEYSYEYMAEDGLKYLKIFGTPFCKIFGDWAFMRVDDMLEGYYERIPENLDILITHDAPDINNLGMINDGFQKGKNAGNKILAKYVLEKKPKYVFCGHIHSGNHKLEDVNGIKMANVSYVNEKYKPAYEILEINI